MMSRLVLMEIKKTHNENHYLTGLCLLVCLLLLTSKASAEARFDSQSGILHIPAVEVEDVGVLAVELVLSNADNLIFNLSTYQILTVDQSRDLYKASYSFSSGQLTLPVVNIDEEYFQITLSTLPSEQNLRFQFDQFSVPAETGESIYTKSAADGNAFSCSICHALTEENGLAPDGFRRPGHPLQNVTKRPDFKNSQIGSMLEAANSCRTEWMNASSWQHDSPQWQLLYSWLDGISTSDSTTTTALSYNIVQPPTEMTGGDTSIGEQVFNQSCAVCHGLNGAGTLLAPKIVGTGITEDLTGQRVRTSGLSASNVYTGLTGGIMPFWAEDRLSDTELKDVAAYLFHSGQDDVDDADSDIIVDSACAKTSNRIGMVAELTGFAHNVSGTATIVDDCTIVIENFNFDGGGIVVEIYAGNNGDYHQGFSLSSNIFGQAYVNDTFIITIPSYIGLNQFDGISVWCVAVGVSFGDGRFQ